MWSFSYLAVTLTQSKHRVKVYTGLFNNKYVGEYYRGEIINIKKEKGKNQSVYKQELLRSAVLRQN